MSSESTSGLMLSPAKKRKTFHHHRSNMTPTTVKRPRHNGEHSNAPSSSSSSSSARHATPLFQPFQQREVLRYKLYRDQVHMDIELHPLVVEIMDTKEFQRLRFLCQLGAAQFVFSGAVHNRFQHSVGVSHLCGELLTQLRRRQPELHISDEDVLCVQIAGLCHDLGHGPFSHVFDGEFIPRTRPDLVGEKEFTHEHASILIFEYILSKNNIDMSKYGLTDQDKSFVKEMIFGAKDSVKVGRGVDKYFLYDIVNNTISGLDVDKLDYFTRDSACCGVLNNFDFKRLFLLARVLPMEEPDSENAGRIRTVKRICFPEKALRTVFALFQTRFTLHEKVYTHKVVKAVELMVTDMMIAAEPAFRVTNKEGKSMKMSECIHDMSAYTKLNDHLFTLIDNESGEEFKPAQKLIKRLLTRKLYKCVGRSLLREHDCTGFDCPPWCGKERDELKAEILACAKDLLVPKTGYVKKQQSFSSASNGVADNDSANVGADGLGDALDAPGPEEAEQEDDELMQDLSQTSLYSEPAWSSSLMTTQASNASQLAAPRTALNPNAYYTLEPEDIIVDIQKIHHGKKDKNPVSKIGFYSKHDVTRGVLLDLSKFDAIFPTHFQCKYIRIYVRENKKFNIARKAFAEWLRVNKTQRGSPTPLSPFSPTTLLSADQRSTSGLFDL
jgi:HD superfamily phosphohydrolase